MIGVFFNLMILGNIFHSSDLTIALSDESYLTNFYLKSPCYFAPFDYVDGFG